MASVRLEGVVVVRGAARSRRRQRDSDEVTVLAGIDLDVADGELVAVVGASGSGKTTLLRAIAGLESPTAGSVLIGGVDVTSSRAADRDVAMVFQQPALLPNRNVGRNVAFPLEIRELHRDEVWMRVLAETRALHIETLLQRSPDELSDGERQLVQVARALVRVPTVLLLDEPLARLDAWHRQRMRHELRTLQRGYGVTTILATNDPLEAMTMPDRLVVLDAGRVVQVGLPLDVHHDPASLVAAIMTGELAVSDVLVESDSDGFWLVDGRSRERAWRPSLAEHVGTRLVRGRRPGGTVLLFDPSTGRRVA